MSTVASREQAVTVASGLYSGLVSSGLTMSNRLAGRHSSVYRSVGLCVPNERAVLCYCKINGFVTGYPTFSCDSSSCICSSRCDFII